LDLLLLGSQIRKREEQQRQERFHEPFYTVAAGTSIVPAT
jgi:hypothetical protein